MACLGKGWSYNFGGSRVSFDLYGGLRVKNKLKVKAGYTLSLNVGASSVEPVQAQGSGSRNMFTLNTANHSMFYK